MAPSDRTRDRAGVELSAVLFPLAAWKVRHGMVVKCRVFGSSMDPVIPSGSTVTLEPVDAECLELGDIVIAQVRDSTLLHLVKEIDHMGGRVEIAGTTGSANGWTSLDRVHGICTAIDGGPVREVRAKVRTRFR